VSQHQSQKQGTAYSTIVMQRGGFLGSDASTSGRERWVLYSVAAEARDEDFEREWPDTSEEGCEVSSRKYPAKGAQAKRKADGLIGQVYVSSPTTDLVAVRWRKKDETGTLLYDIEQFSSEWELMSRSGAKWKVPAGAISIVVLCGIGLYVGLRAWESTRASRVAAAARQQTGADGRTPGDSDGAAAQKSCSMGANEYLQTIAGNRFRWLYGATPDGKFKDEVAEHAAPGITTSVSDKLLIEDSNGVFRRVELVCSYDSGENKVLRYWIADDGE
jgi:hypothetical protein